MSAYAYIGLQGSGKTLKAVNKLYENFIATDKKNKSEYDYALTNINEFDFSKSDKINKLDFDILYSQLVQLFDMSVNQKCTDTELNEKAKEFKLFNCLIIVDEAPHYLTKEKDEVLLWWIEYHRHMYQDIILITPNKARFRTEYRNSIHYFVRSVSAKYRLRKSVYKYAVFSNYNMNKDDFEHFESFKVKKELFTLYKSGKSINGTPVIYKFYAAFIFLAIAFIIALNSFFNQISPKPTTEEQKKDSSPVENTQVKNTDNKKNKIDKKVNDEFSLNDDEKLFKIRCDIDFCFISLDGLLYEFPYVFMKNILKDTDSKKLKTKTTKAFITYFLITDKNNFNFIIRKNLTKGVKNEDTKKNNSPFSFSK